MRNLRPSNFRRLSSVVEHSLHTRKFQVYLPQASADRTFLNRRIIDRFGYQYVDSFRRFTSIIVTVRTVSTI